MREYIAERLAEMKNPEERSILKKILTDVFISLYDETESKYNALENRVRNELPFYYDAYVIYSTVLPRAQVDGKHAYLSPIIAADAADPADSVLYTTELSGTVLNGGQPVLETVFYSADYWQCRQIIRDKRILDGAFTIQGAKYPFKFKLQPAKRYMERVEKMYHIFLRNDIPWTTINCAYLNKFFDVCLIELPEPLPRGAKLSPQQIELSFGPYQKAMERGLLPVWNIDIYHVKGEDFPVPVLDTVNYEYHFDTNMIGGNCAYLMDYDNSFVLSARREQDTLVVVSPQPKELAWDLYRFCPRQDTPVDRYLYPILTNARHDSFSTRLMNKYGTHITTKAEMRKLLSTFQASEYMELTDFHFADRDLSGGSYDMNPFIINEVRDPAFQKTMALLFKAADKTFFLNYDILSFLVSEFQMAYPEFRCVGAII
ncbi:MAG: hypothetical protein FWC60_09615 [Firmicutes bacterium]|nr:hypothetical protein [Bacillota bacterium]